MTGSARMLAACVLACANNACLAAQPRETSHGAAEPPQNASAHEPLQAGVAELLRRAEMQLAAGDTDAATASFDRAALMQHAPEIEMGLVRAYLQAGEYRRALAFGAHASGAHLESAAAGGLYAWLLRAGGQRAVAERTLAETLARWPSDPVASEVARAFSAAASAAPIATPTLLATPHRMAPVATMTGGQMPVAAGAAVLGSGVLIDSGARVLVPESTFGACPKQMLWVRNGLGQTSAASIDSLPAALADSGLRLLRLAQPLPPAVAAETSPRPPFAGSPAFLIEYATAPDANPAWPTLFPGFLGTYRAAGPRPLGIDVADGPHGGPVFDGAGRLAGLAVRAADGGVAMVPVMAAQWASLTETPAVSASAEGASTTASSPRPAAAAMAPDQVYERALRMAVQVIAVPAPAGAQNSCTNSQ